MPPLSRPTTDLQCSATWLAIKPIAFHSILLLWQYHRIYPNVKLRYNRVSRDSPFAISGDLILISTILIRIKETIRGTIAAIGVRRYTGCFVIRANVCIYCISLCNLQLNFFSAKMSRRQQFSIYKLSKNQSSLAGYASDDQVNHKIIFFD